MTCEQFLEQVEAYALGALEPEEQRAGASHLAQGKHTGPCLDAVAQAQRTVAQLGAMLPRLKPPPHVWREIEAQIRPAPSAVPVWRERLAWGLAAIAALALVFFATQFSALRATTVALQTQLTGAAEAQAEVARCREDLQALGTAAGLQREAIAVLDQPGSRVVPFAPQPGQPYRASVILSADHSRAFVVSAGLSQQAGHDYELWVIRGSKAPIPAGLVHARVGGVAVAEFDRSVLHDGVDALAVSMERAGGSTTGKPDTVLMVAPVKS